jgi:hypothetical protein
MEVSVEIVDVSYPFAEEECGRMTGASMTSKLEVEKCSTIHL